MTACHAPGSVLGARDMAVNQTNKFSALTELLFYMRQDGERRKLVRSEKKTGKKHIMVGVIRII